MLIGVDEYNKLKEKGTFNKKVRLVISDKAISEVIGCDITHDLPKDDTKYRKRKKASKNAPIEAEKGMYQDSVTFCIKDKLTTLNEYINAERTNRFIAANLKKKNTKICEEAGRSIKGVIDPEAKYNVIMEWSVTNNRVDSDNIFSAGQKFCLDGLVSAGVISGDGRKYINNISHTIETGSEYFVNVTLYKCG